MGTRHLVCVYSDHEFKVAQFGQYDGYPAGTGVAVLDFADTLTTDENIENFKKKLLNVNLTTYEELKEFKACHQPPADEVLSYIAESTSPIYLVDSIAFSGDSLYCEWAYVINLDNKTFNVYSGFIQDPSLSAAIFQPYTKIEAHRAANNQYYPVELVASYGFENLPSYEDFIDQLKDNIDEMQ